MHQFRAASPWLLSVARFQVSITLLAGLFVGW